MENELLEDKTMSQFLETSIKSSLSREEIGKVTLTDMSSHTNRYVRAYKFRDIFTQDQ